ncbi:MAG TPA: zinc ribbon domain-containing protein [Anaerolineae bacterium]|nr:zinc ribbon domain-containing protein [Anaerolineae bacterium]
MEQRIFHGHLSPDDLAECLLIHFHRGNLRVQQIGQGEKVAIQILTREKPNAGGETALGITFQTVEDGVAVHVGKQAWFGIAASLGYTALSTIKNPFNLLHRIDDIAQDIEYLQLQDEVWKVLEANAKALGTGYELSERLRRTMCEYCGVANPAGEPSCIACGAPLGKVQPSSCKNCGYIIMHNEKYCPNCKQLL